MIQDRFIVVLYLTATCNLNCRYCYIDKSPALQKIDELIEESYKGDYYINFLKKMYPDPKQLIRMEFWGGEPSYGLPRAERTVRQALDYYPNLSEFFMSTNLTTSTFLEDFYGFVKIFKDYPNREFKFDLQLSLDGPTAINDNNRGKGTTAKFTENFAKLITAVDGILADIPNLTILPHFKPTLDADNIANLQTRESIIKYFKFFENYVEASNRQVTGDRWCFGVSMPNTATPSPHTTQDGKNFANFCKIAAEITAENKTKPIFKYYQHIVPFRPREHRRCPFGGLDCGCSTCGTGRTILGLLPNNLISVCHNGFTDLIGEYKDYLNKHIEEYGDNIKITNAKVFTNHSSNKALYTPDEYPQYEHMMTAFNESSIFQTKELATLIQLYARIGQIDSKYKDYELAKQAAHFIFECTSSCIRDNMGVTGSRYLTQVGFIKLFLNGAKEWIEYAESLSN